LQYDKAGEQHYNLISALHKSLRDGDPDGALYWLGRMLAAGEDPLYVARRMVRFASEDVGNADPNALTMAVNGVSTYHFLGSPEGELALFQVAAYLATAPKSNRIYSAQHSVNQTIKATGSLPVPLHLRNAPTRLMRDLGYGRNYRYAHDYTEAVVDQTHLPEKLGGRRFYTPTDQGYEQVIKKRLARWQRLRRGRKKQTEDRSS
jgi:putative ATPase